MTDEAHGRELLAKAYEARGTPQWARTVLAEHQPLSSAEQIAIAALLRAERAEAEVAELADSLADAQRGPWPDWAERIHKLLSSYGYDPVDGTVDLPGDLACWLDEFDPADHARALAAEAEVARLREAVEVVSDIDVPGGAWDWIDRKALATQGPHRRIETPNDASVIVFWYNEKPSALVLNLRTQFNWSIQYRIDLAALQSSDRSEG